MWYYSGQVMSGHEIDMKSRVATNIKAAMEDADVTAASLARALGDHERQVRRWRNGETVPSFDNVVKLAVELDREPGWFYVDHAAGRRRTAVKNEDPRTVVAAGGLDERG